MDGKTGEKIRRIHTAVKGFAFLIGVPGDMDALPGQKMDSDVETFHAWAEQIAKGPLKILLTGAFKAGKSTLINALVGKETVPVKATPCTAVSTVIVRGGKADSVRVYRIGEDRPVEMTMNDYLGKFQYMPTDLHVLEEDGCLDRGQDIAYAEIESPETIFRNGVRIIDTPGLGAASQLKATQLFLPTADAVIFLINACCPLSREETEYIETHFIGHSPQNVFFVINRMDMIDDSVRRLKKAVNRYLRTVFTSTRRRFDKALYKKRVFYISAIQAYQAKQNGKTADLDKTDFVRLEEELTAYLTSPEKIESIFRPMLAAMAKAYTKMEQSAARSWASVQSEPGGEAVCQHMEAKKINLYQRMKDAYYEVYGRQMREEDMDALASAL